MVDAVRVVRYRDFSGFVIFRAEVVFREDVQGVVVNLERVVQFYAPLFQNARDYDRARGFVQPAVPADERFPVHVFLAVLTFLNAGSFFINLFYFILKGTV